MGVPAGPPSAGRRACILEHPAPGQRIEVGNAWPHCALGALGLLIPGAELGQKGPPDGKVHSAAP